MNANACAAPAEKPVSMNKLLAILLLGMSLGLTSCNYPGLSIHCIFSKSRPDIDLQSTTPYIYDYIKKEDGFGYSAFWDLDDTEHTRHIAEWWQNTDDLGTEYIIPYGTKGLNLILSKELIVTFEPNDRIHFAYTIYPKNDDHRTFHYGRDVTDADKKLLAYLLSMTQTTKPHSFEEWHKLHPDRI